MAGFFGLFNYEKLGPGVDKREPQKKDFVVFFELYFRKFWKLILANLLYVLVALPVVTVGLANAGLTYITRNFARQKHAFIPEDFFDTIRKNWKQALPAGIINLLVTALLLFDMYFFFSWKQGGWMASVFLAISACVYVIFTVMKYYLYMMMITFKLKLKQLYKNSFILVGAALGRNALISLVLLLFYAAGVALLFANFVIGSVIVLFVYLLLFPAFRSFLIQFTIFPVIKKYMIDPYYKEHPGEDLEQKRSLNIEDEYTQAAEEAPVFQDERLLQPDPEETDDGTD